MFTRKCIFCIVYEDRELILTRYITYLCMYNCYFKSC